ncbi:hypothetical protein DFH06DRAFT_1149252 [Mycena polygramma]|nr:hypothetical protein DFH06DRAFT_1149252 [Mycena polygramma]
MAFLPYGMNSSERARKGLEDVSGKFKGHFPQDGREESLTKRRSVGPMAYFGDRNLIRFDIPRFCIIESSGHQQTPVTAEIEGDDKDGSARSGFSPYLRAVPASDIRKSSVMTCSLLLRSTMSAKICRKSFADSGTPLEHRPHCSSRLSHFLPFPAKRQAKTCRNEVAALPMMGGMERTVARKRNAFNALRVVEENPPPGEIVFTVNKITRYRSSWIFFYTTDFTIHFLPHE